MTLSINGKTYEAGELIAYVQKLEKENSELKKKLKEKLKTIADKDLSFVAKFDALEKENAELRSRDCWKSCEYTNPKAELIGQHIKDVQNLTKAKELIKNLLPHARHCNSELNTEQLTVKHKILEEAEQFLKENKE